MVMTAATGKEIADFGLGGIADCGLRIADFLRRRGTETEKQVVLRVLSWDLQKSERVFCRFFLWNRYSSQ